MNQIKRVLRPASCVLWACIALVFLHLTASPGAWAVPGDICGNNTDEPDGFVGIADLNRILGSWNQTCDPGDWTKGDITGDGEVGIEDMNIVLGHWSQSDPDPFLGTNLAPIAYWNSNWTFVDVMKMARPWLSTNPNGQPFDTSQTVITDTNGWPILQVGEAAHTQVFDHINGQYPITSPSTGPYVCTFDGTGTITFGNDATNVQQVSPGIVTFEVTTPTKNGILMRIVSSAPSDHVRNIKLWMPGFENATSPFHPLFISRLKPFKVLRFMDWQDTNGSNDVQWSDRKLPTDAIQNRNDGGVALEYIIQLCNELGADPWFCMPHQADDNYVTQFAQYVKANLHPNAKIYVEWSNEVWNSGFGQYNWVGLEARKYVIPPLPPDAPRLELGAPEFYRVWAEEAANDFTIWKSVFTGDPRQIVRVAAGWKDLPDVTDKMTSRPEWLDPADPTGNDVLFDAIACSTYLRSETDGYNSNSNATGVEDILQYTIDHTIPLNDPDGQSNPKNNTRFYMDHAGFVQEFTTQTGRSISFISYEGGQHFVPNNDAAVLKLQINGAGPNIGILLQRHPLMYKAYADNIAAFKSQGGSLFMAYYSVGKYQDKDTFGHFEFQDESINNAPKHRAVVGGGGR